MSTGQERQHRKYSPSQTERLRLCLGSANLLARTPPRERTEYSEEGDKAHEVLHVGLETYSTMGLQAVDNSVYCCEKFPHDFTNAITDALSYVWAVMEYLDRDYGDAVLYIETYVDPPVAAAPGEAGGYCDIAIFSRKARTLYTVDYKHGVGVAKEALDNAQVMQYAAGYVFDPKSPVFGEEIDSIVLAIVQPRAFHVAGPIRESRVTRGDLKTFLDQLNFLIESAQDPKAPLTPGLEQCQFCDARSTCPALEARALAVLNPQFHRIEQVNERSLPDPKTIDPVRLGYIKASFGLLHQWMNAIDTHVEELVKAGTIVPGWKLVEPDARREWYDKMPEAEQVQKIAALAGCRTDELYKTTRKPLTEVEKLVVERFKARVGRSRRKQAAEEAKQYFAYFTTKKPSPNLALVSDSDPRPAINRALKAFSGIEFNVPPSPYTKENS